MVSVSHYRDLEIWQEAMDLCAVIYQVTKGFPRGEQFGLTVQMRRASVSIPSNIAEGFVRKHAKEVRHLVSIAISSIAELDTQIALSLKLGYIEAEQCSVLQEKTDRLGRKMTKFYQGIRS